MKIRVRSEMFSLLAMTSCLLIVGCSKEPQQTAVAIADAVATFESNSQAFDPHVCRKNAERFSRTMFRRTLQAFVEHALSKGE